MTVDQYAELRANAVVKTAAALEQRIGERFPDSGLFGVAGALRGVGDDVVALTTRLRRPVWPLRIAALLAGIGLLTVTAILFVETARRDSGINRRLDLLQATETAVNEVILLSLALMFLVRAEGRWKRRLALGSLHRLRSVAHVVDMHQLTKDPTAVLSEAPRTASSPERSMTPYQLTRYLDYCSELLALTSKFAALHAQGRDDQTVLAAVNDVESLALGLSGKIWQKIMILDLAGPTDVVDEAHEPA
jgi:hypothetical protein